MVGEALHQRYLHFPNAFELSDTMLLSNLLITRAVKLLGAE